MKVFRPFLGVVVSLSVLFSAAAGQRPLNAAKRAAVPPQYQIFDLGVVLAGDTASQGFGV